jgi:HD-like signal output (HDOD) protein
MIQLNKLSDRDLPPLKAVVLRLWQLLNSPTARLQEMAEAMSAEPVLCARIMAVANSPAYRGVDEITSPQKALVRMGLNEVKGIVYYLTLSDSVRPNTFPPSFSIRKFWTHSLCTALLSKNLLKYYPQLFSMTEEDLEQSYLAGLLHDIGYVLMATLASNEFTALSHAWAQGNDDPLELEERIFGTNHTILSAKALNLWKFPKNIQISVYAHHRLSNSDPFPASIVLLKLADYLATEAGYSFNPLFSLESKRQSLPNELFDNDFQPLIEEVSLKVEALVSQTLV